MLIRERGLKEKRGLELNNNNIKKEQVNKNK
jgi:hypothetical protein